MWETPIENLLLKRKKEFANKYQSPSNLILVSSLFNFRSTYKYIIIFSSIVYDIFIRGSNKTILYNLILTFYINSPVIEYLASDTSIIEKLSFGLSLFYHILLIDLISYFLLPF